MLIALSVVLACILVLIGVLLAFSHGKPKPFLDENGRPIEGSISEKIHVNINGLEQGMFIRGRDKTKPVLLFLHGGPGLPEYFLTKNHPTGLEDYFTVCWWEQRGAGLSYIPDIPLGTMTVEQLISDTREVTKYLCNRFGKEKIYLMGHSGGSFFGILAAARSPELYHAYIGIAQMSQQHESEKLAYTYMVEQYKTAGDQRMLKKLGKFPVDKMDSIPDSYRALRDDAMHKIGIGTMHTMKSVITGLFLPSFINREYSFPEKIAIWRGKWSEYSTILWHQMLGTDLTTKVTKLDIPVYFFHGIYDYTVSYTLAMAYFEKLQAPKKGFYTFEQSAHSPLFEEPVRMIRIIQEDVMTGLNNLADK